MILPGLLFLFCVGETLAQYHPTTTPVPILKQINRHNEDGSYTYGFSGGDGSFKIETKLPNGEVYGRYGFYDDTGNLREVEYGATRRGFEPIGTDISVPPATIQENSISSNEPEDDGQYREDPSIYYTDPRYTNGERYERPPPKQYQNAYQRPAPRPLAYAQPQPSKSIASAYRQPVVPQQELYRPQYKTQYQYPNSPDISRRYNRQHPVSNYEDGLSSYTVEY